MTKEDNPLEENFQELRKQANLEFPEFITGFAYGSGIFAQEGYEYGKEMPLIDMIFVVEDVGDWHRENMRLNLNHYTGLPYYFGSGLINLLSSKLFPLCFFPDVTLKNGQQIKFGTISKSAFLEDLDTWKWMSLSGRLHKPVRFLEDNQNPIEKEIKISLESNLGKAFNYSTLSLSQELYNKDTLNQEELELIIKRIVGLSYKGDIRMNLKAESSSKIDKIFEGSKSQLLKLYSPFARKEQRMKHDLPYMFSDARLSSINSKSSTKMALNQLFLNSFGKSVRNYPKVRQGILQES